MTFPNAFAADSRKADPFAFPVGATMARLLFASGIQSAQKNMATSLLIRLTLTLFMAAN
jgi:hypothetical protein